MLDMYLYILTKFFDGIQMSACETYKNDRSSDFVPENG